MEENERLVDRKSSQSLNRKLVLIAFCFIWDAALCSALQNFFFFLPFVVNRSFGMIARCFITILVDFMPPPSPQINR